MKRILLCLGILLMTASGAWAGGGLGKAEGKQKILVVYDNSLGADIYEHFNSLYGEDNDVSSCDLTSDSFPGDENLLLYDQVWDIRYNSLVPEAQQDAYTLFLKAGKSLFLMGENDDFMKRNTSISEFVEKVGGGTVEVTGRRKEFMTIAPPFNTDVEKVQLPTSGISTTSGTGEFIVYTPGEGGVPEYGSAILWDTNTLAEAPKGVLIVVFDVNFMMPEFAGDGCSQFYSNIFLKMADELGGNHTLTFTLDEGVVLRPGDNPFEIEDGGDYYFYLSLDKGYSEGELEMTVNGEPVELIYLPKQDEWHYVLRNVKEDQDVVVTLQLPTANVNPEEEVRFFSEQGALVVSTPEPMRVTVYNITGKAVVQRTVESYESISLPQGIYIVRTDKGTAKVVVR